MPTLRNASKMLSGLGAFQRRRTWYTYEPLDQTNSSIRLITLQPSSDFDSDIHCDIFNVSLDEIPTYEALSYAWGDASIIQNIYLHNQVFTATTNLVAALRHIRLPDVPRTMWIDAICIDQGNIIEREQQVAFMRKIYSMATLDILWLGEDPNNYAGSTFDFITALEQNWHDNFSTTSTIPISDLPDHTSAETDPFVRFLRILIDPPVWQRIWIVQELAVSRLIVLHLGNHTLPWDVVASFVSSTADPYYIRPHSSISSSLQLIRSLVRARLQFKELHALTPILDLWTLFQDFRATDPRDMVFALMGLADPECGTVDVDYSREVSTVFSLLVRDIIDKRGTLEVICLRGACASGREKGLPSWVLDFSEHGESGRASVFTELSDFFASGDRKAVVEQGEGNELVLHGARIDVVGEVFRCDYSSVDQFDRLKALVQSLPEWLFEHEGLTQDGRITDRAVDVLARTLIAGTFVGNISEEFDEFADDESIQDFGDAIVRIRELGSVSSSRDLESGIPPTSTLSGKERLELFVDSTRYLNRGYALAVSHHRRTLALVPKNTREDDTLVVLFGSPVPHVLRRVDSSAPSPRSINGLISSSGASSDQDQSSHRNDEEIESIDGKERLHEQQPSESAYYEIIGTSYVHGFMTGEIIKMAKDGQAEEEIFTLI